MKKRLQKIAALAALTAAALLTAACGSGKSMSTAAENFSPAETAAYYDSGYDSVDDDKMEYSARMAPEAMPEEGPESAVTNAAGGAENTPLPAGRKLIRNADMDVETDSFDTLLSGIYSRISELGGYVEQSSTSGRRPGYQNTPIPRSASITARIPSAKLDQFITTVEESGNVVNKTETTEDVTLKYSDIESRKKSLTIEQDRIWELLEKADTLEAVITLEERLSEIRYQLESMESQLRLYDNQVDYSTITLRIEEVTIYTPTAPETPGQRISSGFARNLERMSNFFVNLFIDLAAGSPIWVPIGCIILLAVFLGRWRIRKKRKTGKKKSGGTDGIIRPVADNSAGGNGNTGGNGSAGGNGNTGGNGSIGGDGPLK